MESYSVIELKWKIGRIPDCEDYRSDIADLRIECVEHAEARDSGMLMRVRVLQKHTMRSKGMDIRLHAQTGWV